MPIPKRCMCLFNDRYIVSTTWTAWRFLASDGNMRRGRLRKKWRCRYLSAWVALNDVSEENGTLRFKKNEKERFGPDLTWRRFRQRTTILTTMNAGSIVFFIAMFYASGKNMSDETRRAWMPQYNLGLPTEHEDSKDSFRCLRTQISR